MRRAAARACHYCRRLIAEDSCRQERLGWYCTQRGLQLGEGVPLYQVEPVPEPWTTDPEVLAAAAAEALAEQEWERANTAWLAATQDISEHRILSARYRGSESDATMVFSRSGLVAGTRDARERQRKLDAEAVARDHRNAAANALSLARVAYAIALRRAATSHHNHLSRSPDTDVDA